MGKIFNYLGVSTGCIVSGMEDIDRKKNYDCDITYGTNNELGFDYLRDNMKYEIKEMVQRGFNFCIVDEVDSILIDESRTPLVISGKVEDKSTLYKLSNNFVNKLQKDDYELDEKNKNVILTDRGVDKIEKLSSQMGVLKNDNFYDPENLNLVHHVNQSLKANLLFKQDSDYIVKDGKVQIIDEFTGRILEGEDYQMDYIKQLKLKKNVQIQRKIKLWHQLHIKIILDFKKLSGMTGTALTEAEEFFDIYKLNVVSIPTNKSMVRKDFNDQIFRTEKEKHGAILNKIKECNKTGQPVLVGTTSIDKSEKISKILSESNLKHSVLNAKHHEEEANIIASAGKKNAITIATNMAGRGTDIKLGGNKNFFEKNGKTDLNEIDKDREEIKSLGGLFIIGTERHEVEELITSLGVVLEDRGTLAAQSFI